MKSWQHTLAASMKHPAAAMFVARLNQEEQIHKETLAAFKASGMLITGTLVQTNERTGAQIRAHQVWRMNDNRRDKIIFNHANRRQSVEYTTEVRMSKKQVAVVESLISADWAVWCGVRLQKTGASAVVLRLAQSWAVVYENGMVLRGNEPVFQKDWPQVLKPSASFLIKQAAAAVPAITQTASGGFKMNRYA